MKAFWFFLHFNCLTDLNRFRSNVTLPALHLLSEGKNIRIISNNRYIFPTIFINGSRICLVCVLYVLSIYLKEINFREINFRVIFGLIFVQLINSPSWISHFLGNLCFREICFFLLSAKIFPRKILSKSLCSVVSFSWFHVFAVKNVWILGY